MDAAGMRAIGRRFQLALVWIGTATMLGALLPVLDVYVFTAFLAYYRLPVSGELGWVRPRTMPPDPEKPPREESPGLGQLGPAEGPGLAECMHREYIIPGPVRWLRPSPPVGGGAGWARCSRWAGLRPGI